MDPLKELEGLDPSHMLALVKKLGGREVVNAILRGEQEYVAVDTAQHLFDRHGRRIPKGLEAPFCDANYSYYLKRPAMNGCSNYEDRLNKLMTAFEKAGEEFIHRHPVHFMQIAELLKKEISENPRTVNLLKGVCLPVVMPQLGDSGNSFERVVKLYEKAAEKSFCRERYPRNFSSYSLGSLLGKVSAASGSFYNRLYNRTKQRAAVGLYFPTALQGFSVAASREQMKSLPKGFVLSGLDVFIALAMYPDILSGGRGQMMGSLQMAALDINGKFSLEMSFRHESAGEGDVSLTVTGLESVCAADSSGLLYIGK